MEEVVSVVRIDIVILEVVEVGVDVNLDDVVEVVRIGLVVVAATEAVGDVYG